MVLIKEYRIPLPLTVEEYQVGQLYAVAEMSRNETGGGEGVEVLKNERFTNLSLLGGRYTEGQYTHKIFHVDKKAPGLVRLLAPKPGSWDIHEECWNAYPYIRTVISNPNFMKDNFTIVIESLHVNDRGESENVHELTPEQLKEREVVHIDIAHDAVSSADYKPSEDPSKFTSERTGRGPLSSKTWHQSIEPVMTCYKLVTCEFKWFGLQTAVEMYMQKSEQRLFNLFHRQVVCSIDKWHGMTMDDIRELEDKTKDELDRQLQEGEVRGMRPDV